MASPFQELQQLASKLNQATDKDLNSKITRENERLNKLKLGIEVWLDQRPVEVGEWKPFYDYDEEPTGERYAEATLLGYCRVGNDWALAVKNCSLTDPDPEDQNSPYRVSDSSHPTALLRASRNVRIKCLRLIPALIEELKSETAAMLNAIEEA